MIKNLVKLEREKKGGDHLSEEYTPDIITLLDEDNIEHEFEILDIIENDRGSFYALAPYYSDPDDFLNDTGEYIILESVEKDGEYEMIEIEDEALLDKLADEFEEHFNELFEFEDQDPQE